MTIKKSILGVLVFVVSAFVFTSFVLADTLGIDFESYTLGNIHAQDGWSKTGPYDVEVESNTYGFTAFGTQLLRISNSITSGSFGDQTFSKSLVDEAGESSAQPTALSGGVTQNHFEAEFDFASTMLTEQPGLFVSLSPDRGDGARMGYVGFDDQPTGVDVIFYDYQDVAPYGSLATPVDGCSGSDNFVGTTLLTLDRSTTHKIKLTMDFVEGPRNDVVKLYVDNVLVHTGTSWEDYFRWCTESGGGVPNDATADVSRTVDSILFRVGGTAAPATSGFGFLFDNLTLSSSTIVGPPTTKESCMHDGWMSFTNPTFKNQGDCVSYVQSSPKAVGNKTK